MADEGFDGSREVCAEFAEEVAAFHFREFEGPCGGVDEAAHGLEAVSDQSLAEGDGVEGEGESVNKRVPGVGFAAGDGVEVAAGDAFVAEGAEPFQLGAAGAAARFGERFEGLDLGQLAVEGDHFAQFVPGGVVEGAADGGQFMRQQDVPLVMVEEASQGGRVADRGNAQGSGDFAEGNKAAGGPELLGEWMPVAQPFGGFAQQDRLQRRQHVTGTLHLGGADCQKEKWRDADKKSLKTGAGTLCGKGAGRGEIGNWGMGRWGV